ncbi:MAG: 4Fe-4S dicluster domain-containing protein [Candidatus Bathyarchaeia archaeon]
MLGEATKDIFQLLYESAKKKREEKAKLLESLGIKEYFEEGSIRINKRTCQGIDCMLCIKACPTNALYWALGEVKITEELCIYCTACVLSCIVDDCIRVTRRRPDGRIESYSTPTESFKLLNDISSEKRLEVTNRRFPKLKEYIESLLRIV